MLLLYLLWDDWPIFMISGLNEQLQQELEYTLLKPECHSWWISKMQSGPEEERYAIKFSFILGKNAAETYEMLQTAFQPFCMNRTSVFEWHKRFKEGRESVRDDERCGRNKEVNTPELIGQRVLTFGYSLSSEAVIMRRGDERGCDKGHWHAHTRGLPWSLPEVVGTVQQVHYSWRRLLRRGLEFHVCTINKSAHTKKVWKLI